MATVTDHVLAAAHMEGAKLSIAFHSQTKAEARALIQRIGGRFKKNSYDGTYWVTQQDEQAGWKIQIFVPSMCKRVQVGETAYPEVVLTARTVPTYEYQCDQLFDVEG